jgi:hypothetical protein
MTKSIGPLVLLLCALVTAANGQTRTFTYIGAPVHPASGDANLFSAVKGTVSRGMSGGMVQGRGGPEKRSANNNPAPLASVNNIRPINIKAISFTLKNPGGFSFVGQPSFDIPGQNTRITGVINFVVQSLGPPQIISIGICYQKGNGPVASLMDNPPLNRPIDTTNRIYVVSATGLIPFSGPMKYGPCVGKNTGDLYVSTLDGWLMSTTQ